MPLHALELVLDEDGEAVVRRQWRALRDAGLPSQADHAGATNAPHLTLLAAPDVGAAVTLARELVVPLLPAPVRAAGLLLLGGRRLTVARAVDVPDPLVEAVLRLRAATPGAQHLGWLPHLTLARRLPRVDAQRAIEVLGHDDDELTVAALRRWDPDAAAVSEVRRAPD